jgi:putative copper resistance protein D
LSLLVDLFGYLSIILHGLVIVAQSMALGGVFFLLFLARPFASQLPDGETLMRRTARIAGWAALALALGEALTVAMQCAVLTSTLELPLRAVIGANFAVAGIVKLTAALLLAALLFPRRHTPAIPALLLCAIILAAAVATTHATARLDDGPVLLAASALHILGAAIWVGGIPCFVMALGRLHDGQSFRRVGARFSRMSMVGVGCILVSATVFSLVYIGSWGAAYGTAYGVMAGAKAAMFGALLLLGFGNFLVVERLRRNPATSVLRMRRFAEVEIGIGFSIFFAAASLTSVPPAVDLTNDRVTWAEIVERNTPVMPRLVSPDHDALALPALQSKLDAEAAAQKTEAAPAFVPGSGELPVRNAADIAWSEYNHHWAGIFVVIIGVLGLLNRGGIGWAKHWPLALLGLAVFLFLRSDPEVWPLGNEGVWASLRDVEVLQHRMFVTLIVAFALFEWGVRTGRLRNPKLALVFPLLTALGGALLLTHSHAIANVKDQLLIELTHTPLALAGIAAGWARWLEIRADGPVRRWAGWVWPLCFLFIGVLLLLYREA